MPIDMTGLVLKLVIGMAGALIIVFLRLIGAMPRPWFDAGITDLEDEVAQVNSELSERLEELKRLDNDMDKARNQFLQIEQGKLADDAAVDRFNATIHSFEVQIEKVRNEIDEIRQRKYNLQDEATKAKWKEWSLAAVLYVVIGGATAAIFAPNPLVDGEIRADLAMQVIVNGAFWASTISLVDSKVGESKKNEHFISAIDAYEKAIQTYKEERKKMAGRRSNRSAQKR